MRVLNDCRRSILALGALTAFAAPLSARAEPYLFSPPPRAPAATRSNDWSGPHRTDAARLAKPVRPGAPARPNLCRRLIRDARYGYVEVRFAC